MIPAQITTTTTTITTIMITTTTMITRMPAFRPITPSLIPKSR